MYWCSSVAVAGWCVSVAVAATVSSIKSSKMSTCTQKFRCVVLNCVTIQLLQCFVNSFLYTGKMDDFVDMILKNNIPISNFPRWLVLLMKYIAYVSRLLQLLKMKFVSP